MKIVVYGINFSPELTGIGKYTGELALGCAALGHEVRVITTPPHYPQWSVQAPYRATRYQVEQMTPELRVYRCPIWVPRKPSGVRRILSALTFGLASVPVLARLAFWQPDAIFVVAPSLVTVPFALCSAKLMRWKCWLHVQDFEVDAAFQLGLVRGEMLKALALAVERALLRRFDRVSTISLKMLDLLRKKGLDPARARLIRNWVDTSAIHPIARSSFRVSLDIADDASVCLYSGSLTRKQGLHMLIDCAKLLLGYPDLVFVIAGEGEMKAELVEASRSLSNVRHLYLQPPEALNDLLALADIHLLPQSRNAADLVLPSKLTGMLASGRPVIASAAADTELGLIVGDCGLLVGAEDSEALAAAVLILYRSPSQRDALGDKGRAYAIANLDAQVILRGLVDEIKDLVGPSEKSLR